MVAGREEAQQGVLGGQPGREREAVGRAFEHGEVRLERGAGGVAAAGVLEGQRLADRLLGEGAGQRDRRAPRRR